MLRTFSSTRRYVNTLIIRNFSRYFTKEHEWIDVKSGIATIGITNFAQEELGEIVHVELPPVGDSLGIGDSCAAIESVKIAADIYSPVDGEITEVNENLIITPNLLNTDCENDGWIAKIEINESEMQNEFDSLMDASQYEVFLEEAIH